jgi:myosin heavy subunit
MKTGTIFFVNIGSAVNITADPKPVSQYVNSDLVEKVKTLNQVLTEEKAKVAQLEAQLKKQAETDNSKENAEIGKLKKEISEKETEINALKAKISKPETTQDNSKKLDELNKMYQEDLSTKQAEINALNTKISALTAANQEKVNSLENENKNLKSGITLSSIWAAHWVLTLVVPLAIFTMGFLLAFMIFNGKSEKEEKISKPVPEKTIPQGTETVVKIKNSKTNPTSTYDGWLKRTVKKDALVLLKNKDGFHDGLQDYLKYVMYGPRTTRS